MEEKETIRLYARGRIYLSSGKKLQPYINWLLNLIRNVLHLEYTPRGRTRRKNKN